MEVPVQPRRAAPTDTRCALSVVARLSRVKEDAGEEEEGEEEGEEEEGSPGPGHSVTDLTQSPGDF